MGSDILCSFWTGQSVVAILATLFMVLATELGYQVYDTLLSKSLQIFQLSRAQTLVCDANLLLTECMLIYVGFCFWCLGRSLCSDCSRFVGSKICTRQTSAYDLCCCIGKYSH